MTLVYFLYPENVLAFSLDGIQSGMTLGEISKISSVRGHQVVFIGEDQGTNIFVVGDNDNLYLCDGKLFGLSKRLYDSDRAMRLIKDAQVRAYVLPDEPHTFRSSGGLRYTHRHMWKSENGFEGVRVFMEHDFSIDNPMTMLDLYGNLDPSARFGQKHYASGIYEEHFDKFQCRDGSRK